MEVVALADDEGLRPETALHHFILDNGWICVLSLCDPVSHDFRTVDLQASILDRLLFRISLKVHRVPILKANTEELSCRRELGACVGCLLIDRRLKTSHSLV